MTKVQVNLPPKMVWLFDGPARYRVAYGGRGSGKTMSFAIMSAIDGYRLGMGGASGILLCGREFMNSLDESSMEEVKAAIQSQPFLNDYYEIGERYIRSRDRRIEYAFAGLRHNLDSIKSKAKILRAWVDEAENVSESAWQKLTPTVREPGSEIWVSYNPESPESATHRRFRADPPDDCRAVEINWRDNPWFPDVLNQERLEDQRKRADVYDHIWEGGFLTLTDAQIFAGAFEVDEFEPLPTWDGPYQGLDFGFAQDPTAAVRCYIHERVLYIRHEAGRVKLELDKTADFVTDRIPDFERYAVRADSARPESISYLKRHGLPSITAVEKWKGSVEDGIEFMRSFDRIVIHPDCPNTAREFRLYSYKVDRLSGDILPVIVDEHNHYIDAIRYALAPLMRRTGGGFMVL